MIPAREHQHASALVIATVWLVSCGQQATPAGVTNFDSCLIMHMSAIAMLEGASNEADAALLEAVIASQNELLRDDKLDADELAQRASTLLHAYSGAADAAIAEAEANSTSPQALAAEAMACRKALAR
ncbi:MAG TPA: hypothetical protein DEB28_12655 [Hyphomonas sp.]|jgi:hypothetical protein|nr:hypothetical protein [Hyphomonas sp.]MAX83787.1 hypothetical protein [Hyphomonas sp.]HBT37400.1 hypothetical protein [Hyphomonas sp.]HBU34976.1 hypothetical protein [Hyphomonas sp.]HBX91691.1 hypothetical protein [Hyphomonas sp.]|tara:strand:- start:781 stop:1164 length:384 start_codon:yes stop_codon:yes gene_type:complete